MHTRPLRGVFTLLATLAIALACGEATAQFDVLQGLQLSPTAQATSPEAEIVKVSAQFTKSDAGRPAMLFVTAEMQPGWHIYSITQPPGGPIRSQIKVEASPNYKVGEFTPEPAADRHPEPAFDNLPVETHEGKVTWYAPLELAANVDAATLDIKGSVYAQACAEVCHPPKNFAFTARLGDGVTVATATAKAAPAGPIVKLDATYKSPSGYLTIEAGIDPETVATGGSATLVVRATPAAGWHVYALADRDPQRISKPTLIVVSDASDLNVLPVVASVAPEEKPSLVPNGGVERFYKQPVEWRVPIDVPQGAAAGEHVLRGMIGYQTCMNNDGGCDAPRGIGFEARLVIGGDSDKAAVPAVRFTEEVLYKRVADAAVALTTANDDEKGYAAAPALATPGGQPPGGSPPGSIDDLSALDFDIERTGTASDSLLLMMGVGFLGGLILNLMPCVFPVIGLKILAFVEQGHHHRSEVLWLNVVYSLGILSVFMILATLPVVSRLVIGETFGWGEQFASNGFKITLAAIVFAMALSFLGIWEIPIPGFAGGRSASTLAAKEGAAGAFFKGVITTILATPCSGPFLGTALTYAVAQPAHITYTMFASIGIGMASPYLLIGAFPRLIRFLPKPGAWMDTFKHLMGFVLLATVVFLMSTVHWALMIPTLAFLIVLWAACWWIGRVPLYEPLNKRLTAWAQAVAFASLGGWLALGPLHEEMRGRYEFAIAKAVKTSGGSVANLPSGNSEGLAWQPLSMPELNQLLADGRTVLIDFTADWCFTCKSLEKFVLNTAAVRELVDSQRVVTLMADMTEYPAEESKLLETLGGSRQVPVLAIFPAGRPTQPIVLTGGYTQATLLEKLREAGPSKAAATETVAVAAQVR